jgi:HK97 family phage major capsid protein
MKPELLDLRMRLETAEEEAKRANKRFGDARTAALEEHGAEKIVTDPAIFEPLNALNKQFEEKSDAATELRAKLVRLIDGQHEAERPGLVDGIASKLVTAAGGVQGLKALTTTGVVVSGYFDQRIRDMPLRQLFIRSVIATESLDQGVFAFARVSAFTNAAAAVAAGGTKPESTVNLERVEDAPRTIAHVISDVDRTLLLDFASIQTLLDQELRMGVLLAEENQILNGNGTAPNLRGILNTSGIGTQARGTDSRADAIHKAITICRLSNFEPDTVVLHPTDWQTLRLEKASSGDYLAGPIVEIGPDRIWGKTLIQSPVLAQGVGLVGNFQLGARLYVREDATVQMFEEPGWKTNTVNFRGEERIGLAVERPAAFCQLSGL